VLSLEGPRVTERSRFKLWRRRVLRGLAALAVALAFAALVSGWRAFGHRATGARLARVEASPNHRDGRFVNPEPLENDGWLMLTDTFRGDPNATPRTPVPFDAGAHTRLAKPAASGLRATWLGHSTTLLELGSHRVLTDPIWSERASPLASLGPRRSHPPPLALADLPPLDAVLISHDHYDHLDFETISALRERVPKFIVPLGIGAHLAYWGVAESRIVELDWWQRVILAPDLEIVCVPARHATGRVLLDNDAKEWAGYALLSGSHRVYFSGDTGLFPALREIGQKFGPFDLTLIEIGQYGRSWPDWHLGPEQAVRAHQWVRGKVMLPIHWATFTLAFHGWTEPVERALAAARAAGVTLVAPKPGQSIEPSVPEPLVRWWPNLPWRTAAEDPIVATQVMP
jgi:L-ascorbate metabolism protein UlaG (beta-lactamase superfamily)